MTIAQILPFIAALLPAVFASLGATLAGFLRQDGFSSFLNGVIAIVAVIVAAIADVLLSGQITGNWQANIVVVQATMTILLAGGLKPLASWVNYLQSNALAFLPAKNTSVPVLSQVLQSVQNIEQAIIPGIAPRASTTSTKAAQPKALVIGNPPTTPDTTAEHSG